jgi:hypothetical protein
VTNETKGRQMTRGEAAAIREDIWRDIGKVGLQLSTCDLTPSERKWLEDRLRVLDAEWKAWTGPSRKEAALDI